jgi:hypothetical protein
VWIFSVLGLRSSGHELAILMPHVEVLCMVGITALETSCFFCCMSLQAHWYMSSNNIEMTAGGYGDVCSKGKRNILMDMFVEGFSSKEFFLWPQYSYINSFELDSLC